jgi:hypothetical protein
MWHPGNITTVDEILQRRGGRRSRLTAIVAVAGHGKIRWGLSSTGRSRMLKAAFRYSYAQAKPYLDGCKLHPLVMAAEPKFGYCVLPR